MKVLSKEYKKISKYQYINTNSRDVLIIKDREKYSESKPKHYLLMQFQGKGKPKYISSIYRNKKGYSNIEFENQYYNITYDIGAETVLLVPYEYKKKGDTQHIKSRKPYSYSK